MRMFKFRRLKIFSLRKKGSNFVSRNILLLVVFLTGGALLILEVVATRILSPFFGNTIFSFSSVIGTVLGALSLGYYCGGKMADRWPTRKYFFGIILAAGFSTSLLAALSVILLPIFAYHFSTTTGPLVFSVILFTLPSFLLGMLSPYVIKLQEQICTNDGIGTIAGKVFFWSTLGSIAGSLSAGFLLIPHFGIQQIVIGVAIGLILIGILGLFGATLRSGTWVSCIVASIFFTSLALATRGIPLGEMIIHTEDGTYQKINVLDAEIDGQPARILTLGRGLASAIFPESDELPFAYTRYHTLQKILLPDVQNALVLGAGAYVIPMALHKDLPSATIDVVDIEKKLLRIAKDYFGYTETPNIVSYFEDGRRFLHDTPTSYDLIFGDAYSSLYSIPAHLSTREFFQLVKEKLKPKGVFIGNFIGSLEEEDASVILSLIRTFRSEFPNSAYFATKDPENPATQNIIFVGLKNKDPFDYCAPALADHPDQTIRKLCEHMIDLDRFDLSQHSLLTDNYAPIEYLSLSAMKKNVQ